ncbi:MAG: MFS transporter [Holosporales bacterium]|jgi:MFS family permease|nr:MFS transporter [Holosporales bacterium]
MKKVLSRIPGTIKAVGAVSFLLNASTLMVFSIFGLYLRDVLKISYSKIGFLDGAVEAFSFVMKVFSGIISDFLMNRKCLFLIGTFFLFIAKPLEAVVTGYWPLFHVKILERLGNGLQSTPRDAIVGDWAPKGMKATCFGLRQSFAALGSVTGAVLAAILFRATGDYQFVFWLAAIPSLIAFVIVFHCIKEKKAETPVVAATAKYRKITLAEIGKLGPGYWVLIAVAGTYMISKVTESITILHAVKTLNWTGYQTPICMICYQLANSVVSLPFGMLSDKLKSRENVFIIGIVVFIISDLLFIFGKSEVTIIAALIFLGAYVGVAQSIFPAKIIDIVPKDLKGTGIGIFNLVCAASFLVGGTLAGYVAEHHSLRHTFILSSCLASVSLVVLIVYRGYVRRQSRHDEIQRY